VVARNITLTNDVCSESAGPKLLILHGLLGTARNWMAIAKRLRADHEVHALDLRNHGRPRWADGMDYRALAADVAAYIDQHALGAPSSLAIAWAAKSPWL
jgi:esterase